MSKAFVTFTGIDEKNQRRELQNRHVFLTSNKSAWLQYMDKICEIYDFEKINKISVLSDAAKWIMSGLDELRLYESNAVTSCLCEFHFKQSINRITTDKERRKLLISYVNDDKKSAFKKEMAKIKELAPARLEKLKGYENYITNNWSKIHNMEKSKYKSSMEAQISHQIAKRFSSRPKAFSRNRIENYLKLQEYHINGIDILNLYIKTCDNRRKQIYDQQKLDFSILESRSDTTTLPAIQNGLCNGTYCMLKKMIA